MHLDLILVLCLFTIRAAVVSKEGTWFARGYVHINKYVA